MWWNMTEAAGVRTADVFLFGRSFVWVRSLLDVYDQLALRLVLVHWSGGIVDLISVNAIVGLA